MKLNIKMCQTEDVSVIPHIRKFEYIVQLDVLSNSEKILNIQGLRFNTN